MNMHDLSFSASGRGIYLSCKWLFLVILISRLMMCGQNIIRSHPHNKTILHSITQFFDMQSQQCTQRMKNGAPVAEPVSFQRSRYAESGLLLMEMLVQDAPRQGHVQEGSQTASHCRVYMDAEGRTSQLEGVL